MNTKKKPEIGSVYLWQNMMVMVFDKDGQQIPKLQGPAEHVETALTKAGWPRERWQRAVWG